MRADILIIGGGIVGSSIAYHLVRTGRAGDVLVVERDPSYEHAATPRSNGGIRRLFSLPENIEMASYGLAFYRDFASTMALDGEPADINFRRQGYLFISDAGGAEQMERNYALQTRMGVEAELLSSAALGERFPSISTAGVDLAVLSDHDAWIDPHAALEGTASGLKAAVTRDGERFEADLFVNACGAWCAELAASVDLALPVEPMSRESYYLRCEDELEPLPFLKTESDLAFRPDGVGYVGGVPDWSEKPGWNFDVSPAYFESVVWPALAARIPAMERIRLERSWRGHYARSALDLSPILGKAGLKPGSADGRLENFILANGFSGHGIMHAPAAGRGLAELILDGGYASIDLSCFGYQRVRDNRPYREQGIV